MSEKKITPSEIEQLKREKLSGKFQDKGLPLRNPSQTLVSANPTQTTSTNDNNSKSKK